MGGGLETKLAHAHAFAHRKDQYEAQPEQKLGRVAQENLIDLVYLR